LHTVEARSIATGVLDARLTQLLELRHVFSSISFHLIKMVEERLKLMHWILKIVQQKVLLLWALGVG
jgi:hypothetical protein